VTKLLYVEHDDDNLYMLKMRLERVDDFEVLAVGDSEKGCELAVLEMPVIDRWEAVRHPKKDAQTGHIWLRRVRCQTDRLRVSGRHHSATRHYKPFDNPGHSVLTRPLGMGIANSVAPSRVSYLG
jgi:hypothetical protein